MGENAAITASDLTLGQINLTPKACAALVKLSNRLLSLSTPSAEAMVRRDIAVALALKIDLATLKGTGTETQPLGIANTTGINTVTTSNSVFDFDHAADMVGKVEENNALRGQLGFVMHPNVSKKMKKLRIPQYNGQTGGEYIIPPIMSDRTLADALGYDFYKTTQVATGATNAEVFFGNWQELIIGEWGGLELMASNETSDAFEKNQTWIRATQEVDIALRHPESFCLVNDADGS